MPDETVLDEPKLDEPKVDARQNEAREAASLMLVEEGGVTLQNFAQQVDYAKWMAQSRHAIPAHLRGNVGACLAVLDMSLRWDFSPYQVARLSYLVNDQLAFQAQLVHAVIEKFAPLKQRLRFRFEGEGDARKCVCTGHFKGEIDPVEYASPEIGKISPKNSPLWKTDPDQQLTYLSVARFGRRYCPEVMLGIYTKEEMEDAGPLPHVGFDNAKDVSPKLRERLNGRHGEGFTHERVAQDIEASIAAASATATSDAPTKRSKRKAAEDEPDQSKESEPAAEDTAAPRPSDAVVQDASPPSGTVGGEVSGDGGDTR